MSRRIFTFSVFALFASVLAAWYAGSRQPQQVELVPSLSGQPEYCLTCHADLTVAISHRDDPNPTDCLRCHDRTASGGNQAYDPSSTTCGQGRDCHAGSLHVPADGSY